MRWFMLPVSIGAHVFAAIAILIVPLAAEVRVACAGSVALDASHDRRPGHTGDCGTGAPATRRSACGPFIGHSAGRHWT